MTSDEIRKAKANALEEAADAWQQGGWAESLPKGQNRAAVILGMAQNATEFLRNRAKQLKEET